MTISPEDKDIQDGWAPVAPKQIDTPPVQAQAELVGEPFRRNVAGANDEQPVMQGRVVRIVSAQNEKTGLTDFHTLHDLPEGVHPSDLPRIPLAASGVIFDRSDEGAPMLPTARKQGASTAHVDTDAQIRARGGDPNHRTPKHKQGGWISPEEQARVKELKELGDI